jgi:hypothetical protein
MHKSQEKSYAYHFPLDKFFEIYYPSFIIKAQQCELGEKGTLQFPIIPLRWKSAHGNQPSASSIQPK